MFGKYGGIEGMIDFGGRKGVGECVEKGLVYYGKNVVCLIKLVEVMGKEGVKGIMLCCCCRV